MHQWTIFFGTKAQTTNWPSTNDLHSWWKRKIANPISKIDDFVKHVFQEHNQEADLWATIGAEGQRKNSDRCNSSENVEGGERLVGWQLQRQ